MRPGRRQLTAILLLATLSLGTSGHGWPVPICKSATASALFSYVKSSGKEVWGASSAA